MKPFTENLRYEYDLTPDSWVVDAGAHLGDFAREITKRYDCNVFGFEPVFSFWMKALKNQSAKTLIVPIALGGNNREETIGVSSDSSGMFSKSHERTIVNVMDVYNLRTLIRQIDLLKLNIEGMEYEVLERILELGMQRKIENIQVQFHEKIIPNYYQRRLAIQEKLADTHELTYEYPYIWESWKRK